MTPVGIVVLAYGHEAVHEDLVEQLLASAVSPRDVVVVHNPSASDPGAMPRTGDVDVVEMATNAGYAGGMNAGVLHHLARGCSHVLLLTQDTRFEPGALGPLLDAAPTEFGVLGPVLRWDAQITCYGGIAEGGGRVDLNRAAPSRGGPGIVDCDWIDGSAMLVRREVFDAVGVLDERFFMYFEDSELCLRASRAGFRIGVVLDSVASQDHGYSRRPALYAYLMTRNGLEYARRAAGWNGLAMAATRTLLSIRRTSVSPTLRGLADFALGRFGAPPADLLLPPRPGRYRKAIAA